MKDQSKTKQVLIQELASLGQRISELERSESERKQVEEALRESEALFHSLIDYMHDAMIIINWDGSILFANRAAARIIEFERPEELAGHNIVEYLHPDSFQKAAEDLEAVKADRMGFLSEYRLCSVTGRRIWVESIGGKIIFRNASANLVCIRDITERKRAEEALRESEERYRTLVENASDVVFRTDENGYFTFVNPAALRITGYGEEEIIGKHYKMFIRPDMFKEAITSFANQLINKIQNTYTEYPILTKEGHGVWLGQNTQLIMEEDHVTGFQAVARDITERKRMEEELRESERRYRELSIIDDLTQLYNSRHFYFQLKIELDRSNRYEQPLTLLLLDLDDFKAFNDAYGHVEGDQVLCRLGQVVKRCLRQTDSAYRYGGEEFTILLPMTTSADGAVTAERIRAEFKKESFSPAPCKDVHLTVSIGLGQYKPQEEMKAFIHRVDQLMYQGKKNGKDRVCCES